jgi:CubicO group peptidase (beta-lactamase class C family)
MTGHDHGRGEPGVEGARGASGALALALVLLVGNGGCADDVAPGAEPVVKAAVAADGVPGSEGVEGVDVRYRAFADRIAGQLQAAGVPGGALGIVEGGKLVFATGLGVKRAGSADPVGTDTVFRVASTTKTLVAAAVMSLAEEGVVSLDAPVTSYVPGLSLLPPFDPASLTLRRLLSHTAGVPDYLEPECAEGPDALGEWFVDHPNLVLWSPPGRLWSYSNLGFSLAGHAAERAAGTTFRALVEGHILGPLAMETATFDVDEVIARGDHATAHPSSPWDPTLSRCALTEPPGYMYASVNDLGKLTEAMLGGGGGVLHPGSLLQMALPHASTQAPPEMLYGLGLFVLPHRGRVIVGHPGDLPGMHSAWWMVPEARFGVIMLVNSDAYGPTSAAIQAVDTFVGFDEEPPPDWSTPPADWVRYVGFYDGRIPEGGFPPFGLGLVDVALEGEQLVLTTLEDGASYPLAQIARDTFLLQVGAFALPVTFWRDHHTGQAEYLSTRAGHAVRIESLPPGTPGAGPRSTSPSTLPRLIRQLPPAPSLPFPLP